MSNRTKLVTLPCNGAWQPVLPAFQYAQNTGDFTAHECAHVVDLSYPDGDIIVHHGFLTEDNAKTFARSADNGGFPRATVRPCEPYWYVTAYGRVA